ncbi:hypothetical protein KP78_12560 [Jeotgalibacillus soli]|uniref:Uncharacterized protein n=1 Tax=Jeotgalibacillus soli TaxID=889306 RepID=A0A0C2W0T0_9BACL|nr:hypothetical protein KP78_12560 [Jeotgalibacillus soli]
MERIFMYKPESIKKRKWRRLLLFTIFGILFGFVKRVC